MGTILYMFLIILFMYIYYKLNCANYIFLNMIKLVLTVMLMFLQKLPSV